MTHSTISVIVAGRSASFTRYATPAETDTYPMLTPPAADGILSAIYWHPGFSWDITRIDVLNEVILYERQGNELKDIPGKKGTDILSNHTQRLRRYIHKPAYRIQANIHLWPDAEHDEQYRYLDQFNKRVKRGAFHTHPYFGMRELTCQVYPDDHTPPIDEDADLGQMPLILDKIADPSGTQLFTQHTRSGRDWQASTFRGFVRPRFFNAVVRGGTLLIPSQRGEA